MMLFPALTSHMHPNYLLDSWGAAAPGPTLRSRARRSLAMCYAQAGAMRGGKFCVLLGWCASQLTSPLTVRLHMRVKPTYLHAEPGCPSCCGVLRSSSDMTGWGV